MCTVSHDPVLWTSFSDDDVMMGADAMMTMALLYVVGEAHNDSDDVLPIPLESITNSIMSHDDDGIEIGFEQRGGRTT